MSPALPPTDTDKSGLRLLVLPETDSTAPEQTDETDSTADAKIIIALPATHNRPVRLRRSGEPFQIWKAPPDIRQNGEPRPRPSLLHELARYWARVINWLGGGRFRHSQ